MNPNAIPESDLDYHNISRELDRTKAQVFMSEHNPAFLGSLMCSLNFMWTRDMPTAATDGVNYWWNPDYFVSLPAESKKTELCHELWHVALLHQVRRGSRDPLLWNIACDIRIDLLLEEQGFTFEGINGVERDPKYIGWTEEDIYDDLIKNSPNHPSSLCSCHTLEETSATKQAAINSVVKSLHQATMSGQAGTLPGVIKQTLSEFLEPVIPWQTVLMNFFTDLISEDYSWKRPNRRYQDIYMPSRADDESRLEHLAYYLDVSGSISDGDVVRFNSEVKYIQEVLKPRKLTLIQFDDGIREVKEFEEDDPFDKIVVHGRGGTSWAPVKEHMEKIKPTAAIIFTDMGFWDTITKPSFDIPTIWICIRNKGAVPPFGTMTHIK